LKGLGVVMDAFHGSAGPEIYRALAQAGARVEALRLIPDGNFPTGSPNPTSQGKMKGAIALAAEKKCQAVIGIDGDGDRIVFGSSRGILTAGFAFVPILRACLAAEGKAKEVSALYDPKVSPLALAEWGKLGARPVLFRNGHSQIKDYMTQIGALAAAEESGHYYHRISLGKLSISGENSIMTVLLFLNAIHRDPKLMDHLWDMEGQIFTTGEFNYQFDSDATRDKALDAVIEHFVKEGSGKVTATPDGIDLQGTCLDKGVHLEPGHVNLEAGWYSGYLRVATNEKGVVRSYFSAGDTKSGKRVEGDARNILQEKYHGKVID
jgi:phosphomannomutase